MKALSRLLLAMVTAGVAALPASAQDKKEEEPFWAAGRPKGDVASKMAPVPSPPIP